MNFKIIAFFVTTTWIGGYLSGQVGINTTNPSAMLDIVTQSSGDKVLHLSEVYNNIDATAADINYTQGAHLYIDDQGYVYKSFSPVAITGQSAPFDKSQMALSTTWQTIYTLPVDASIAYFSFFTNFSLASGGSSLLGGKISVGTGTGINLYSYSSGVYGTSNIIGNTSKSIEIDFSTGGAGLQFQLTDDRNLQVKLTATSNNNPVIIIYDSKVTRTK